MSNLKLPTMTFDNLSKLLTKQSPKKLAYQTVASRHDDEIRVYHHYTLIAKIKPNGDLWVGNGGYHSTTTSTRIHTIIRDNMHDMECRIKQGDMYVGIRGVKERLYLSSRGASITHNTITSED